jgi:hypothetical protein
VQDREGRDRERVGVFVRKRLHPDIRIRSVSRGQPGPTGSPSGEPPAGRSPRTPLDPP